MRILITLFEIQDYGGIVSHVENLLKGFKRLGHEPDLVLLRDSDRDTYIKKADGPTGSYASESGGAVNTLHGWYGIPVIGYASPHRMREWQSHANKYDLIIHEIPAPKADGYEGWREIFNVTPVQIVAAHDAHFRDMYPHLVDVADKIKAITCTNQAGYEVLSWCPIPRSFVGAPHIPLDWDHMATWGSRGRNASCAHVWKAWKHMDKVVAAAPHLEKSTYLWMAGDGIEGRYMRSKEKCKPKYKGLWAAATALPNFDYYGLMPQDELFSHYMGTRVMVDMSYSRKFAALGNHFNRSTIEAYNTGMLPLCTNENMLEVPSQRELFSASKTHIGIPEASDPEDVAVAIDFCMHIVPHDAQRIIQHGRHDILMRYFDYLVCARNYLSLAAGEPAGIYPNLETGRWPDGQPRKS